MDYKRFQIHFYQHSGKYFPVYSIILLVLIAGWISLLLLPVNSSIAFLTICIYVLVPLLIIVIFVGWITVWGWYHSWFRYLAYFWALLSRLVRKFLASWWVKFFLFLVAALLFQARWFLLLDREITWDKIIKDFVEFESLMMTVAITLAFMLIYQILKARKRLVISRFENHTGLKEMDSAVTSIGTRILNEMSRLHDLLVDIDEINPQERSGLIENTLMIQDIGKNLENLIGTQSRVEIGSFLKIPLDLFYAFVIRLMQGRMLRGSLHINGDKLILTARLRGGDFNKTWRVNSEDLDPPAPTSKTEMLAKMTEELVCRIFTVLANGAPPRWRAVKYYTQGLRMYRETVNTETKKKINLLQAKQAFIESLREYEFFGQCYYNLGIVYTDLDNKRAAETTFQEGLKIEPDNFDCYFKLALLYYYNHKEPKDTRWICGEARAIFPHHPYPWNLMGVSFFDEWGEEHPEFQAEHKGSSKNITCNRAPVIDKNIVISFRNASLFAWKGLCRSLKKGEERQNKKIVAAICLLNLAKALGRKKRTYCASIFSQSLFLAPHDNEIYYELGKFYYCREKIKKAFNAFIRVCQEDENVDSVQFWALYSHTCAQLYKAYKSKKETSRNRTAVGTYKEIIQNNYMHFLNAVADFIQDIQSKPWDTDSNAYRKLVKSEQVFQINQEIMAASLLSIDEKEKADSIYFLNQLKKIVANVSESGVTKSRIEDKLEVLKDEIGKYLYVDGEWMEAQIKVAGGRALIQNEEDPKLIKVGLGYLIDAFTKLNGKYDRQIKQHKISRDIAEGFFNAGDYKVALFHARIALNYDPFGAKEQHLLGAIYFKLGDYKSGLKAWKISFQLDPPGPNKIEDMGKACAEVGDKLVNPMLRQQMFNEVIDFLHQLQELMENHPLNDNEQGQYVTRLEAIHYYIGVFYGELLEFEKAVYHLRISLKLNDKELRVYNQLGWTFLDMKLIDKAEAVFREAKEIYKNSTKEKKNLFEEINFGLILCQINQSASFTYNTDLEGLLEEAFKRIQPLKNLDIKKRLLSLFHECRGQMALKKIRGKASLKIILSNRYKEPIKDFEQSITYKPTARVYYYLAGCYCQYAQMVAPKKRHRLIHNARRAADLCISHDTRGQYKDAVLLWFGPPEAGTVAVSSTPRDNKSP